MWWTPVRWFADKIDLKIIKIVVVSNKFKKYSTQPYIDQKINLRCAAENAEWNNDMNPTMTMILWKEAIVFIFRR